MADPLVGATPRYRLLATVLTCAATDCPCGQARRRAQGQVHCPRHRAVAPTLELHLRGASIRARCTTGCEGELVQAVANGDDAPLLALYGGELSSGHGRLLLESAVAPHVAVARPYTTVTRAGGPHLAVHRPCPPASSPTMHPHPWRVAWPGSGRGPGRT